jgi:hypothetical protein
MGANGRPRVSVHTERWQRKLVTVRKRAEKAIKEGNIREALDKRVAAYGGETRAVSWLGRRNAPDVLCLFPKDSSYARVFVHDYDYPFDYPALHPFAETKRPKKSATAAQAREHERMRAAGCVVLVITTLEELDRWLPPI